MLNDEIFLLTQKVFYIVNPEGEVISDKIIEHLTPIQSTILLCPRYTCSCIMLYNTDDKIYSKGWRICVLFTIKHQKNPIKKQQALNMYRELGVLKNSFTKPLE